MQSGPAPFPQQASLASRLAAGPPSTSGSAQTEDMITEKARLDVPCTSPTTVQLTGPYFQLSATLLTTPAVVTAAQTPATARDSSASRQEVADGCFTSRLYEITVLTGKGAWCRPESGIS